MHGEGVFNGIYTDLLSVGRYPALILQFSMNAMCWLESRICDGKGSHFKKNGLVMEFFRTGCDPPPQIFGRNGTQEANLIFGHQKRDKQNFPKTPKMAIFKMYFLEKCSTVSIIPYFKQNSLIINFSFNTI